MTVGNPWESISLEVYEEHMSLENVRQLQTLNSVMKAQLGDYDADTAMILGVAGGNGLEHVDCKKYRKVYGVDINGEYLSEVSKRYPQLSGVLECVQLDLIKDSSRLPASKLIIADLLVEYIGLEVFKKVVLHVSPEFVSTVIQINTDETEWASDSPYLHAFDRLDEVHHQMETKALTEAMADIGYVRLLEKTYPLPNGKALVRLDFKK